MNTCDNPIAMAVCNAVQGSGRFTPREIGRVGNSSDFQRDGESRLVRTGGVLASLAIVAAPHREALLRSLFHVRV
jgi:hypothetical protein